MEQEPHDDRARNYLLSTSAAAEFLYDAYMNGIGAGANTDLPDYTAPLPSDSGSSRIDQARLDYVMRHLARWCWIYGKLSVGAIRAAYDLKEFIEVVRNKHLHF